MGRLNLRVLIEAVDRATGPIRRIARSLRVELPSAARIGGAALKGLTGLAAKAGAALGALAGVSFGAITGGVIKVGSQFEQYRAVLETIEGSQAKADAAMQWVQDFAKTTPYELEQVMEAYVALRAYGIDPTDGTLRTLGDTASAMNKSLMQSVEMFADAQTGEFERLKEFGVRGSAAGEQVRLTYQKAGREVTATSKKSATEIRRNLLGIFDSRFAGAMDKQSKTLKGVWSNLMDMFTGFQRQIADAGVFDFVKAELQALLDQVNVMAANGQLDVWAKEIAGSIVELLKSLKALITEVDWVAFTKGVIDAANAFAKFMDFMGGLDGLITGGGAAAIGWLTTALMALGTTIAGALGIAAAPVAAVIAAIGLIALAGWFVYRNWESIWGGLKKGWNGFVDFIKGIWPAIKQAFTTGIASLWAILPPWFQAVLTGGAFIVRTVAQVAGGGRGGGGGASAAPRPAVGQAANGRVQVDVNLNAPRGAATVAARASSPATPVTTTVRRGRAGG